MSNRISLALYAWMVKNVCVIICWTILAIHFEKWWIALFAGLFVSGSNLSEHREDTP